MLKSKTKSSANHVRAHFLEFANANARALSEICGRKCARTFRNLRMQMRAHFQEFADANARALRSAFLLATRAHMQTQCANAREFPTSFRPPM